MFETAVDSHTTPGGAAIYYHAEEDIVDVHEGQALVSATRNLRASFIQHDELELEHRLVLAIGFDTRDFH